MKCTIYLDGYRGTPGNGRQENPAKGITHRGSISMLQWLEDELAIFGGFFSKCQFDTFKPFYHGRLLLRVVLDDKTGIDGNSNLLSCRNREHSALEFVGAERQPLNSSRLAGYGLLHTDHGLAGIGQSHNIAHSDLVRWNVNAVPVDEHVAVAHHLTSRLATRLDPHSENNVVETPLEKFQQLATCWNRLLGVRKSEIAPELALCQTVGKAKALLFLKVKLVVTVLAKFLVDSMLTRPHLATFNGALATGTARALEE